ncbi:MAG: hypothetical protein OEY94_03315 [Alphaproteobacteria bacterium]|nr:hypothetical protein [Alphaproteobacteria bacterium]
MGTQRAYAEEQQKVALVTISGLMSELQKLAPHPDRPQYQGPLFLMNNAAFKQAGEHDGMLGMMIMEAMIGSAFAEAASESFGEWIGQFDAAAALECYSTYITDVEGAAQRNAAHGQGTLARMSGTSISNSFNMRVTLDEGMQAFLDDLPERMKIEQTMAYYLRLYEDACNLQEQFQMQPCVAA